MVALNPINTPEEQIEIERRTTTLSKKIDAPYPLIDCDPHFSRVLRYMRGADYAMAAGMTALPTALILLQERINPMNVGKRNFARILRLSFWGGLGSGFLLAYQQSSYRFYGAIENRREIDMDMREMVDKVKRGEPLYGVSSLSPHNQGTMARNSRYSAVGLYLVPWFNFVNHPYHGVDTAKYYRQAERELEEERLKSGAS
ncbi:NADH-ubiquinone oxidoreductase 21 kDa subunit [Pseudovirgaria hyperparasitica]|uniref:NADH-ubiquinone oxidoreductase 21 kDa subunit n=1 Tax=Pseudovirgaria hyperparasitica TaxID=470096 RepID=A0A6A6WIY4_9PEZI|nr:NADH-ubiquinone oxidoreductase 21 kDa subunit [Pseudovirgaria hyperparasitica]KAF2761211.1 NADH-ubiquinone oxidoreductase 21 kDa subunit [Pseudovirgaria hyperparasitica]